MSKVASFVREQFKGSPLLWCIAVAAFARTCSGEAPEYYMRGIAEDICELQIGEHVSNYHRNRE